MVTAWANSKPCGAASRRSITLVAWRRCEGACVDLLAGPARYDLEPGEAVELAVQGEVTVHHLREHVQAGAGECLFVDRHANPDARHQGRHRTRPDPGAHGAVLEADDAGDLAPRPARARQVVQGQHLLQVGQAGIGQSRMVQRQMGDQAPVRALGVEAVAGRGFSQQAPGRTAGAHVGDQVAFRVAGLELGRQVAVGAGQLGRHRGARDLAGPEVGVDQGQADLVAGTDRGQGFVAPRDPEMPGRRGARLFVPHRVQRSELGHSGHTGRAARVAQHPHPVDAVDLVERRVRRVGRQRIVGAGVRQLDRVAALAKQIDHRRAAEQQVAGRQRRQQARFQRVDARRAQRQVQGEARAAGRQQAQHRRQVELEKAELLGIAEVLGQQPEGRMRTRRVGQDGLVVAEAGQPQRRGFERPPGGRFRLRSCLHSCLRSCRHPCLHPGARPMQEQRVEQRRAQRRLAVDEDPDPAHAARPQGGKGTAGLEFDGDAGGHAARQARPAARGERRRERRAHDPQRRRDHRVHGAEMADRALHGGAAQGRPARQQRELAGAGAGIEAVLRQLGDRIRGQGPRVVRIQAFQQGLGKFRVVVVETLVDACAHQGHRLDQARHARIVDAVAGDMERARRLRKAAAELARELTEQPQLFLEIPQQLIHTFSAYLLKTKMYAPIVGCGGH